LYLQTTHNVEQDGYGYRIHPTTTIRYNSNVPHVNGKLIRSHWADIDFTKPDKKAIFLTYKFFHFWTGYDPNINYSL
jgi:hypothetical protein